MIRHEAVQLVSTKSITSGAIKLVLNHEPLKFLSEQIGNRKVAIISIAGTFRTGKGFFLSLFVLFLEWLVDGAEGSWIDLKKKIDSFHWKSGSRGDTKGIYVYNKPFIVKTKAGDEIAIILMDTQGTYDTKLHGKNVSSIFALSTMLSSVQIYNLKNNINMPDLEHLAFFTHLASHSRQTAEGDAKIFQSLYFLIRDWSNSNEKEFGAAGGDELVKEVLEEHSIGNDELQEICTKLEDNFETVNGFLLPFPGETVANNNNSDRTLEEMQIKQDFLDHAYVFFDKLISNAKPKMIGNRPLEGISLLNIFKQYVEDFQGNSLPEPDSMLRSINRVGCMNAKDSAVKQYHLTMHNILNESTNTINEESLTKAHNKAIEEALSTFKSIIPRECDMTKVAREEIVANFENQLKLSKRHVGDNEKLKAHYIAIAVACGAVGLTAGVGLVAAIPAVSSEALVAAAGTALKIVEVVVKTRTV